MNSRFAHELKHAQQFDNGEISFIRDAKSKRWFVTAVSYDSFDEVNAYKDSVAIGVTNGNDNMNPSLRGIITNMRAANGDKNKELEAYRSYTGKDNKDLIKQNNIGRYPKQPAGFIQFLSGKDRIVACNGGCRKK